MKIIDKRLKETANLIDDKFSKVNEENRSEISPDILSHVRNFCEAFMYKVYDEENDADLYQTQSNLTIVRKYFKDNYYDVWKFHVLLDSSVGHLDFGSMQAEALTIKYIPKLILLKDLLFREYGISILENIDKYPLDLDKSIISFYEKILFVLLNSKTNKGKITRNQYFVRKRSMKYINGYIFYEYVFDVSDDKANKFNTFVCYSFKNIRFDYDLKLMLSKREITFLNTKIFINIIYDYEYSIRPCAFQNLLYLINVEKLRCERDKEYASLMRIIKESKKSLVDLIDNDVPVNLSSNGYYNNFINTVKKFVKANCLGTNIIRLLLLNMRNSTIKAQAYKPHGSMPPYNDKFDGLRIRLASKSFELMPFSFSPKEARPSIHTLLELYNPSDSAEEILYYYLANYINQNNTLFVKPRDIGYSEKTFINLKDRFNERLLRVNSYYSNYKIIEINGYYTIEEYYNSTQNVIINALNLCGVKNREVNHEYTDNIILSDKQKNALMNSFVDSSISLITGAAGTGKTTIIKEFIKNNSDKKILCLTTTNTANNNLKIRDFAGNVTYKNISQFESEKSYEFFDIIIVDEASFVSTKSIDSIFSTYADSAFLFVGDPGQIESIEFGNWFDLLLDLLKKKRVVATLDVEHRTEIAEMVNVWNEVRIGKKKDILELLSAYEMTEEINDDIFNVRENEVVLCLNYDGLYGINNINRYLQASNPNIAYEYQQNLYKVGDPVIFITNDYSAYGIYNNLNGKIIEVKDEEEMITFKIELFDKMSYIGRLSPEVEVIELDSKNYAIVEKMKYYTDKYDSDMDTRTKLPFQIAYAMSIHKAQGLEFDSVKIVITKEVDEQVTKNIFYTALTRAKKKLKVYWQPEVANYVLDNIENGVDSKSVDLAILSEQLKTIYNA
jgi:KaiC/GvpD/RAD55 family RecA-like ATPase